MTRVFGRDEPCPRFTRRPVRRELGWPERRAHAPDRSPYAFAFGRSGLRFGLEALGFGPGDVLLWPEYIAEVVLHPLNELGVVPAYYPVDRTLEPDWRELERQLGRGAAKGVAMVHTFGQLQRVDRFRELCDRRGLVLVEDATHAYGGTWDGRPVGTFGDLGVTSPHKVLPVFNGAYLHVDATLPPAALSLPLQPLDADRSAIDSSWRGELARRAPWLAALVRRREPYSSQAIRDRVLPHWSMDAESQAFLGEQDLARHRTRRRELYEIWQSWCRGRGLEPVFPALHPEASPWAFPAYVSGGRASRRWFLWGVRHGIEVFSWPTLPRELAKPGSAVLGRWQCLVGFPIHAQMDADELQRTLAGLPDVS